jgi:putative addiction module CopG family antidote
LREIDVTIHLKPEQEQRIAEAVRSGAYKNADEVVDQALAMLLEQQEWLAAHRAEISGQIEQGYAAAQRGELLDADEVRGSLQERKTAWLQARERS